MTAIAFDLGVRPYPEVWDMQKRLVQLRASDKIPDVLLLVEHDHVITLGRRTSPTNLRDQAIPVFQVERGGDATYHGPGQLVGYPIIRLPDNDIHRYLRNLEEVLIKTVAGFDVEAGRKEGHTGVWVGERKLASIGVAISSWVTYHGFALNVNTEMIYFQLIKPCGLDPGTLVSMMQLRGVNIPMEAVKRKCLEAFSEVFGLGFERRDIQDVLPRETELRAKD